MGTSTRTETLALTNQTINRPLSLLKWSIDLFAEVLPISLALTAVGAVLNFSFGI